MRRLEIVGAEFGHELAGSEHMSPHGVDQRLAFCLGGVEAQFPIEREDLEMIGVGRPPSAEKFGPRQPTSPSGLPRKTLESSRPLIAPAGSLM